MKISKMIKQTRIIQEHRKSFVNYNKLFAKNTYSYNYSRNVSEYVKTPKFRFSSMKDEFDNVINIKPVEGETVKTEEAYDPLNKKKYLKFKKDNIFTIALIGRPNVGKSTLFNRLSGESLSLVDSTPGLTRDRKETYINMFGVKIRIVDTAGIDDFEEGIKNEDLLNKTINQTRQALIYSDLAFFIIDAKAGVTYTDIKLANWLKRIKDRATKDKQDGYKLQFPKNEMNDLSGHNTTIIENNSSNDISLENSENDPDNNSNENKSNEKTDEFYRHLKKLKEEDEIKIPPLILVANKVEDDYVPSEVFNDFIKLQMGEPILISAEQGDNLHEIYSIIEQSLPESYTDNYNEKIMKRYKRYLEYKEKLKSDYLKSLENLPKDEINKYNIEDWEKDFDYLNKFDIENNSDYDSDNDVDPLDTIIEVPKDEVLRKNMRKAAKTISDKEVENEDSRKKINHNRVTSLKNSKRPIKIALVGQQNVGKSSIINSLLKDNRVIISDVPGTTRDSVPIQWIYKGRRVTLIDTAGLKPKSSMHDKIEKMASDSTIKAIKYCHVVIYVIDAMQAFTPLDMKLIEYIGEEGRSIILVANKWDLVSNGYKSKAKKWIEEQLDNGCSQYKLLKINYVSAKNFYKVDNLMDDILNAYYSWNIRVSTNLLNQFVNQVKKVSKVPNVKGEYLKLKFVSQIKTRPPAFTVFVNNIDIFFKSHESFLKRMMIKEFKLNGCPIRFLLRDHKKITNKKPFSKVSEATAKISKKLNLMKTKMANPTYRRKSLGYDKLYGKKSIYKQMKK